METLATYLIKSSVWLTGFALIYALFLRNERFFSLNRIFLVSGILASIVFPLFTWHYSVVIPVIPVIPVIQTVEVSEPQFQGTVTAVESFPTQSILLFLYLTGAIFIIFRIFWQTLPIFRIIRKSEASPMNSIKIIRTTEYPASFSFISYIFVNPSIDETETNEIVNHEQEHIRQKHWIDLMLFEILHILQWFNPVIWLYGRLIRQNHEFLADERALKRSSNPAIYRATLLNQLFGGSVISLANSFNYSLNKKRFTMMKHTIQSPFRKLKLLLVLPLIAGVFYAFAAPEYQFVQAENNKLIHDGKTVTGKVIDDKGEALPGASIVVSGKSIGTQTDINGNFKLNLTDDSPIVISFVGFTSQKVVPDFIHEMTISMKPVIISIEETGNQVLSHNQKKKSSVIKTTTESGEIKLQTDSPLKFRNVDGSGKKPLIVKDGVIADNQNVDNIPPETIESINILKNQTAIDKYGEKGKNGVIEIISKPKSDMFVFVEEMPEFPGGFEALKEYVASSMQYPAIALENGIIGQVFVNFVVAQDGSVTDAKIARGVDPSLDKEALRIVNNMPKWKPGTQAGKNVRVSYSMPINFTIPEDYHPKSKEKLH